MVMSESGTARESGPTAKWGGWPWRVNGTAPVGGEEIVLPRAFRCDI